jgi:hypothetical protein
MARPGAPTGEKKPAPSAAAKPAPSPAKADLPPIPPNFGPYGDDESE